MSGGATNGSPKLPPGFEELIPGAVGRIEPGLRGLLLLPGASPRARHGQRDDHIVHGPSPSLDRGAAFRRHARQLAGSPEHHHGGGGSRLSALVARDPVPARPGPHRPTCRRQPDPSPVQTAGPAPAPGGRGRGPLPPAGRRIPTRQPGQCSALLLALRGPARDSLPPTLAHLLFAVIVAVIPRPWPAIGRYSDQGELRTTFFRARSQTGQGRAG